MPHIPIYARFCHNGLGLNSEKSESVLAHPSPQLTGDNIAGTAVPLSDKIVPLGVTFDSNFTLSNYISNILSHPGIASY